MTTYGRIVSWERGTLSVSGHASQEIADSVIARILVEDKTFTPKRWWQFWRKQRCADEVLAKYNQMKQVAK